METVVCETHRTFYGSHPILLLQTLHSEVTVLVNSNSMTKLLPNGTTFHPPSVSTTCTHVDIYVLTFSSSAPSAARISFDADVPDLKTNMNGNRGLYKCFCSESQQHKKKNRRKKQKELKIEYQWAASISIEEKKPTTEAYFTFAGHQLPYLNELFTSFTLLQPARELGNKIWPYLAGTRTDSRRPKQKEHDSWPSALPLAL